jgi:hypothetical protein
MEQSALKNVNNYGIMELLSLEDVALVEGTQQNLSYLI